MYRSTLATIYTTPSGTRFAHLLSGADVACIYFPPSLKSLWLNGFSEQVTEAAFFQEQHPFPQTIHLVDNPATPWTWANNVMKYFAALRRAVSEQGTILLKPHRAWSPQISTFPGKDATTVSRSCFPHPVHLSCPSFAGWYFNYI